VIVLVLALGAPQVDTDALMKAAGSRLSVVDATVRSVDPDDKFRVGNEETAEQQRLRAVDATGTSCGTSARVCTRPPRTWLSAPIGR